MTFIPVSRIWTFTFYFAKGGAGRCILRLGTSSGMGSPPSMGSPSTLNILPMVASPTGTVIGAPDGRYSINLSGCGALATAGSGDVLTGIIGAFLAQGFEAWDAARLGAYLHGLCGEIALPFGSRGVIADDLPGMIPQAIRRILPTA